MTNLLNNCSLIQSSEYKTLMVGKKWPQVGYVILDNLCRCIQMYEKLKYTVISRGHEHEPYNLY